MSHNRDGSATRVLAVVAIGMASIVTATVQHFRVVRERAASSRESSTPRWVCADAASTNPMPLLPQHPHAQTTHSPRRRHIS